jgi:hypothetical protein
MSAPGPASSSSPSLSDRRMAEVGAVVRERLGLHYPVERIPELEAALRLAELGHGQVNPAMRVLPVQLCDRTRGSDFLARIELGGERMVSGKR